MMGFFLILFAMGIQTFILCWRESGDSHVVCRVRGKLYFKKQMKYQMGQKEVSRPSLFCTVLPGVGERCGGGGDRVAWSCKPGCLGMRSARSPQSLLLA